MTRTPKDNRPPRPPARKRPVTLKDIAQDVGVSINAVSSVLNPRRAQARVSDATRRAILKSARRLQYQRNVAASRLAGGATRTLGILMARMGSPYDGPLASGFEWAAAQRGYQCFVGCLQYEGIQPRDYVERFLGHGVEGLLLCTVWNDAPFTEAFRGALEADLPTVFVDYGWEEFPAPLVCANHFMGGQLIGRHLADMGHRCIAVVSNERNGSVRSIVDRVRGVTEGFNPPRGKALHRVYLKSHDTAELVRDLAALLDAYPEITALVCDNDVEASRVVQALKACGRLVPEHVAVTGYDDLGAALAEEVGLAGAELDWFFATTLTTVRQPLHRIGAEAAETLIAEVEEGKSDPPPQRVLDVELVVRASSRLPVRALSRGGRGAGARS